MAKQATYTYVSDVSGEPIPEGEAVTIRFTIGDVLHSLDAKISEVAELIEHSTKSARPGRKSKDANGDAAATDETPKTSEPAKAGK